MKYARNGMHCKQNGYCVTFGVRQYSLGLDSSKNTAICQLFFKINCTQPRQEIIAYKILSHDSFLKKPVQLYNCNNIEKPLSLKCRRKI